MLRILRRYELKIPGIDPTASISFFPFHVGSQRRCLAAGSGEDLDLQKSSQHSRSTQQEKFEEKQIGKCKVLHGANNPKGQQQSEELSFSKACIENFFQQYSGTKVATQVKKYRTTYRKLFRARKLKKWRRVISSIQTARAKACRLIIERVFESKQIFLKLRK